MTEEPIERLGETFPVLTDLLVDINVHSGTFGQDRIAGTIRHFAGSAGAARIRQAIAEIDAASRQLPMGHRDFQDLTNYVLPTDQAVLEFLATLRTVLQQFLKENGASPN